MSYQAIERLASNEGGYAKHRYAVLPHESLTRKFNGSGNSHQLKCE
jgi:hypothetical protein